MKKLLVLTEIVKGGSTESKRKGRGKLIITDSESRPFFIEVDTLNREIIGKGEPQIRIHFPNDEHWTGTMQELYNKLTKDGIGYKSLKEL